MNKTTNITATKSQRIINKFQELKTKNQCAFVSYICAGHPNGNISQQVLNNLPNAGVDIIELGVPFLDPAGDGPIIENASRKAIENGMTLKKTLIMVEEFRKNNQEIPIILMSYYNPILNFGVEKFFIEAENAGVDGLLVVDLPIEEQQEIIVIIEKYKIDFYSMTSESLPNLERGISYDIYPNNIVNRNYILDLKKEKIKAGKLDILFIDDIDYLDNWDDILVLECDKFITVDISDKRIGEGFEKVLNEIRYNLFHLSELQYDNFLKPYLREKKLDILLND
jgi:hypothetical protein